MGRGHCDFGSSARIFHSYAGTHKIDGGAADLTSEHVKTVEVHWLQRSELAPGGEFGFDSECDEDAHLFCSDALSRAAVQSQKHRSEDRPLQNRGSAGHALGAALGDVA